MTENQEIQVQVQVHSSFCRARPGHTGGFQPIVVDRPVWYYCAGMSVNTLFGQASMKNASAESVSNLTKIVEIG